MEKPLWAKYKWEIEFTRAHTHIGIPKNDEKNHVFLGGKSLCGTHSDIEVSLLLDTAEYTFDNACEECMKIFCRMVGNGEAKVAEEKRILSTECPACSTNIETNTEQIKDIAEVIFCRCIKCNHEFKTSLPEWVKDVDDIKDYAPCRKYLEIQH